MVFVRLDKGGGMFVVRGSRGRKVMGKLSREVMRLKLAELFLGDRRSAHPRQSTYLSALEHLSTRAPVPTYTSLSFLATIA